MTPSGGTRRGHCGAPMGSSTLSGGDPISPVNNNSAKTHEDTCPAAAVADAGAIAAIPAFAVAAEGAFSGGDGVIADSVLKVLKVLKVTEGAEGAEDTEGPTGATGDSTSVDGRITEETRNER